MITREMARLMAWNRSNPELAAEYGVSCRVIWHWRNRMHKISVPCSRGPKVKDRSHWDWTLPVSQLAKQHGVTRAWVYEIKRKMKSGKFRNTRTFRPTFGGYVTPGAHSRW